MQVTINANGKTVQAEISEGQLKELGLVEQLKKLGAQFTILSDEQLLDKITEYLVNDCT